jgi:hypothetical protein
VRKLAKTIVFFSLSFIIVFVIVSCFKFLSLWVEWAKRLPPQPESSYTLFLAAAHWALSLSLFSSIVLSMNYVVRKGYFALTSIICVMALSFVFCYGASYALEKFKRMPLTHSSGVPLGGKGVILSNSINRNTTAVVLLNGVAEPHGPRVVSVPGQPLVFQPSASGNFELPPVPFGDDTPEFFRSLSIDIRLNAEMFQQKFAQGFDSYLFFVGALIFMLTSLGYAMKFSAWPLANLFLCTLAFRGILAFNTFFNSAEMQEKAASLLENRFPVSSALPLLFLGFGALLLVYSFLTFALKRRDDDAY